MKKLSNRLSVKQSSTKEGQRELLREHTNKINEIIEVLEKNPRLVYVVEEKPYTAMRSTGEYCVCKQPYKMPKKYKNPATKNLCARCHKEIKPQEDVTRIIKDYNTIKSEIVSLLFRGNFCQSESMAEDIADRILAIVKGE